MQPLQVSAPELVLASPDAAPALEQPVGLRLASPRYLDGGEVAPQELRVVGAFVYRGPPGAEELWDEAARAWSTPPTDEARLAELVPLALSPAASGAAPWTGTLVAIGATDHAGAPRFAKAVGGAPAYRVRAFARALRAGVEHGALGPPSPDLRFVTATEGQRFRVLFDTGRASDAGSARIVLVDGAGRAAGQLEIRAAGAREVEIASCGPGGDPLALLTWTSEGDLRLAPAPGRRIVLAGPLEAQELSYLPAGGGARRWL